jgi:hypothetical protein
VARIVLVDLDSFTRRFNDRGETIGGNVIITALLRPQAESCEHQQFDRSYSASSWRFTGESLKQLNASLLTGYAHPDHATLDGTCIKRDSAQFNNPSAPDAI